MNKREAENIEKYKMLKDEIARMWDIKKVTAMPVVVGALSAISIGFKNYLTAIRMEIKENMHKKPFKSTTTFLKLLIGC